MYYTREAGIRESRQWYKANVILTWRGTLRVMPIA